MRKRSIHILPNTNKVLRIFRG